MPSEKTPLIIPSETQAREFDAKLLLACVAAERGFPSVIGSRTDIHLGIASLPRSIYLAKDIRGSSVRIFDIMHKLGHRIVAWDEEGLVPYPPPRYYQTRIADAALGRVTDLFAWGEAYAELARRYPAYPGTPIHVTGNPRMDMLRLELRPFFQSEADRIRARFGNFILVNTNFGVLNHYFPNLTTLKPGTPDAAGQPDEFTAGLTAHRYAVFKHFQALVPALGTAFPDHTIVIRPHPSENHEIWRATAAGHRNIQVVHEGSVLPWLLACRALIHNGCTTGVEAFLLRTPTLAYQPVTSERFDIDLPNRLSYRAHDLEELQTTLGAVLDGRLGASDDPDQWRHLANHIASIDGSLASERIVDVLERMASAGAFSPPAAPTRLGGWLQAQARAGQKRINSYRPGHKNNATYQRHRFPGVTLEEVRERVVRLRKSLGRFDSVRIGALSRNLFRVLPS